MDWDNDSLIEKAKAAHAAKQKEGFSHYFPSADRWLVTSWKARPQHMLTVAQEDKHHNHEHPPLLPPFPWLLLLSMTSYGTEYRTDQFGSAIPGIPPSQPPVYSLDGWGSQAEQERGKAQMLCKHCSVTAKTPPSATLFQPLTPSAEGHGLLWRNVTPSQADQQAAMPLPSRTQAE